VSSRAAVDIDVRRLQTRDETEGHVRRAW